ncbi:MAG: ComEC/Rec2 family competence protein [Chloroflexota bacterium]
MPLFWLSIALLAGIVTARLVPLPPSGWVACAASCLLLAVSLKRIQRRFPAPPTAKRRFSVPFLFVFLGCFAFGAFWFQRSIPKVEPGFIAWYNDLQTPLIVEGSIAEPPDERDGATLLRIRVGRVRLKNDDPPRFRDVHGMLLARVPPGSVWRYGDRVRLEGQLETPPTDETFSYRDYLAHQGIYSYMGKAKPHLLQHSRGNPLLALIYAAKKRAHATLYTLYPDPEASLLAGILLGIESGIPQDVQDAFTATGTSHIVAISGFNIAIIAGILATFFGKLLGKRWGAVVAIAGIILYTILVGAAASVVRAAIMGSLGVFAGIFSRRQVAVNTLLVTAAVMCLRNPHTPWDVGFQLSFAATLGLVLYGTPLGNWLAARLEGRLGRPAARKLSALAGEIFLMTLAAQLLTLPLIIYHFGRVSLVSFVVNPLVLPVQPPLMILGGLSVIAGVIWLPLGTLFSWLAWPLVAYSIRVIEWMAPFPGGNLNLGDVALPSIILAYAAIFVFTLPGPLASKIRPLFQPAAVIGTLALLAICFWRAVFCAPDGRLHVVVMDVGPGDGILIRTPSGRNVLIDGGPSLTKLSQALGRRLPPTGRRIDWLVVACPGDEQLTALPRLLERFPVTGVLWAGPTHGTRAARDLQAALVRHNIPAIAAQPGQRLDLGDGARLDVLTAGTRGAILLLTWDRFRLLLPIGADFEALESLRMGADIGPVSAMLLADGGYTASNPAEWIRHLRPQAILLSVSPDDRREHPSPETLDAVAGYPLLRTDRNGWIELTSDGRQMWVTVARNSP